MNTQLILDLLTQSYNDLTNFFVGLGLLDNELAISQLKTNFETAWHNFLAEYKLKKEELNLSNANLEILLNEVILDQNYQLVEEERLQDLLIDKSALEKRIEIFQEQKSSIENFSEAEKQVINSKIIQIKDDILQTEEQLEQHRQQLSNSTSETEINELKLEIKVLQKELIAHILRLETQKDLLGLSDLDLAQKLATVELQISQESDDLERLNTIIIPEQETIVANANDVLLTLESKLNNAETTQLTAENSLTNFEQTNNYLLTDDFTNFLDWNIIDNTPEVVKDWQKVLGLQNLEITEDRLISFQSQAFLEDSVSVALGINNLESFIQLEQQLATEIQTLSDIWWTNLEDSHDWTIKVFNLIQNRTDSVNDLVIYIEDNLAIPEEDYVLDQINLKEAIALQEAQVKYRDSLAQSVDSLEEAISVFETRVEQTEILSEEISFLSTLTNLEQEYVTLGDQASQSLRLQLIDILQQDIEGRNEDLVVQIDLSNKQQEIQIETVLHQYIEDKQNKIIDNQAIQLTLLNETFEQPNNGVYLDGVNDYINVESQDNVRISNALTLEAWIKPQANNKRRMIFGREREYLLSIGTDNKIYFGLYVTNPGWRWISTNYTVDLNQWTHIAFTYTEEQGIKLYADGELVYTYQTTGAIINNTAANPYDLRIGNRQEYGNIDSFKGEMDEVRVWNIARTQTEIQTYHNRYLSGKEEGLVGYWNFEETEGDTVYDLSSNNNNGTLINGVQRTISNQNLVVKPDSKSLYFDGVNDYIKVESQDNIRISDALTLEAWIKPQANNKRRMIFGREREYLFSIGTDNKIHFALYVTNPGWRWISTNYTVDLNQWTHLAFTYTEEQGIKLYADGELVYTYQTTGAIINNTAANPYDLRIGNRQEYGNIDSFKGEMDEVRVWNLARTQAEIQGNLDKTLTGEEAGLIGYWNFEEADGDTVYDLTNNNNNGTLINGVQRTISNQNLVVKPDSKSLYFDGVNDYIKVESQDNLRISDALTLEAWIKPQANNQSGMIFGREREYLLYLGTDNKIYFALYGPQPSWRGIATDYTVNLNEWTHIAFTWTEEEGVKLFANGELVDTYQTSGAILHDTNINTFDLRIGNRQHTLTSNINHFKGEIDEVRVWNVARTQTEIQANLDKSLTGGEAGLVGYWNFEEVDGDTVDDLTDNNNNGTLINGVQTTIPSSISVPLYVEEKIQQIEEETIDNLGNLRGEIAYLTLQAEQDADKLQEFLQAYQNSDKTENTLKNLRDQYYPALSDATTLTNLKQQITDELISSQQEFENLKAQISQKQAASAASLSQADWYEEQAEINWELSKKQGPTWNEYRQAKGACGRSETVTITHVDHYWIIWDAYTKQAESLRQYAANLDQQISEDTYQKDFTESIISQWQQANAVADEAELAFDEFVAQLEALEAQRQLLPNEQAQLDTFKALLPVLQQQFEQAQTAAEQAKLNRTTAQTEFDNSSEIYQTALENVLIPVTAIETETQNLLQNITNSRLWVEQQMIGLDTEISETEALINSLNSRLEEIKAQNDQSVETETKIIQIKQNVDLLTYKKTVLTKEKETFTQKLTLLAAQENLIEIEHQLLLATIESPDDDYSYLENQLEDAQTSLEQAQALAAQAESSSLVLSTNLRKLQAFLEDQDSQYLDEIKAKQTTLQSLIDTIDLKENYTLQATQKQLELNTIENELLVRLQEATDAGSQEAQYLLEVAANNNFATAAEIYYTDYRDIMTDTGGGCTGGIATIEDAQKADYYHQEMLKYRALQEQAQEQADYFAQVKAEAQAQIDLIEEQKAIAETEFNQIQTSINNTQGDIEALEKQLSIAEIRLENLQYLRDWTEQIQLQLLRVEQLNLAQAQLEQEFALARLEQIDETITAQFNRQQLEIDRERAIATTKLEQLNQLQAEDTLQQALNDLRVELGLQPLEDIIQLAEYKGQLAGLVTDFEDLQQQPDLPEHIKTQLAETTADIYDALQGKESATIADNLLESANALTEQASWLQTQINELDAEETQLNDILIQSQTDLQGAAKILYDEIQANQVWKAEYEQSNQEYLQVLYEVGYAQEAVDLSSELAQQSRATLETIIEGRIQEREIRKKAFVNELIQITTIVVGAVAAVFTAGAGLAALGATAAGKLGFAGLSTTLSSLSATLSGTTFTTIAKTLSAVNSALKATQSAYNEDWGSAVFHAGMATLSFADVAGIDPPNIDLDFGIPKLKDFGIDSYGDIKNLASGVYNGYHEFESGDEIGGFLTILNGALPIGLSEDNSYLSDIGLGIQSSVELAQEENWLGATASLLGTGFTFVSNQDGKDGSFFNWFKNEDVKELAQLFSGIQLSLEILSQIGGITKDGSIEGWINGIQKIYSQIVTFQEQQRIINEASDYSNGLDIKSLEELEADLDSQLELYSLLEEGLSDEQKSHLNGKVLLKRKQWLTEKKEWLVEKGITKGFISKYGDLFVVDEIEIEANNKVALFLKEGFNPNPLAITIPLVHGFRGGRVNDWTFEAASALENNKNHKEDNVVILNWKEIAADLNYFNQVENVKIVGEEFVKELENLGINFNNVKGIGHSLGARVLQQMAKYTSENYEQRIDIIQGLDKAGPIFQNKSGFFFPDSSQENIFSNYVNQESNLATNIKGWLRLGTPQEVDPNVKVLEAPKIVRDSIPGSDHSDAHGIYIKYINSDGEIGNDEMLTDYLSTLSNQLPSQNSNSVLSNIKDGLNSITGGLIHDNPIIPNALRTLGYTSGFIFSVLDSAEIPSFTPVIIDLDKNGLGLSDITTSDNFFDIDADGYVENTAWTTDGILSVDVNNDGIINDISEIVSKSFNNSSANSGLEALTAYDTNNNGIISASDELFSQILVWQDINQNGFSEESELENLAEHGITSINLNGVSDEVIQNGNTILKRSLFNRIDGTSGEISDVAFQVTQTGFEVNQTDTGIEIIGENDQAVSLYIHEQETDLILNLAEAGIQMASGNIGNDYLYTTTNQGVLLSGDEGNDTLEGGGGDDWLIGGAGIDSLIGNGGDDVFYIDAQDSHIDGGNGFDTAIVSTSDGVTLDLTATNLETVFGNSGNDVFSYSGDTAVLMDGGNGNDLLTGGDNDDILNGGEGDDVLTGGLGSDRFSFSNVSDGIDTITDFTTGDDLIELSASGFDENLLIGQLDNNQFIVGTQALTSNHRLIYNDINGALLFDSDGNGVVAATKFASLDPNLALTNKHFVVV